MDPFDELSSGAGERTGVHDVIDRIKAMYTSHADAQQPPQAEPSYGVGDFVAGMGRRAVQQGGAIAREVAANYADISRQLEETPGSPWWVARQARGAIGAAPEAPTQPEMTEAPFGVHSGDPGAQIGGMVLDPMNLAGAGAVGMVGKAARRVRGKGMSMLERLEKPTLRPEGELVGGGGAGAGPLPDAVPRSKQALTEALGPGNEDMVRSMMVGSKEPTLPGAEIEKARATREALRAERAVTPGPQSSPEEWAKWGEQHGVNMTVSEPKNIGFTDPTSGRDAMIPGGLEGKFTIPDLFWMKANNFDPNVLPQDVHNKLMKKFIRTYEQRADDPVSLFNDLNFSLLSPNAPLTQNEFLAARTRATSIDDLKKLAARAGDPGLSAKLDAESGVGAAARGGMGVKGTAELDNQAALAKLVLEKPEMFKPGEGETLRDVGFRVMNQVPGLSVKTASLGIPWSNLAKANTSAVDLHMIRNFYPRLMAEDPEFAAQVAKRVAGGKVNEEEAAIGIIGGGHPGGKYRLKGGKLNPNVPDYLKPEKLAHEPDTFTVPNKYYQRVMDYVDESRGANPDIELFPEQWRLWDRFRGRVEPHELMHPDFRKLPKQSFNEMQAALQEHKNAGYTGQKPVMAESDWRKLYYGNIDPRLAAGLAAGSGAAAGAPMLRDYFGDK